MREKNTNNSNSPENTKASELKEEAISSDSNHIIRRTNRVSYFALVCALIFALLAIFSSGYIWWQYQQYPILLSQSESQTTNSISDLKLSLDALIGRINSLQDANNSARDFVNEIDNRVQQLPERFEALERRISLLQGISDDTRRGWLFGEAQYYLTVADTTLSLYKDRDGAITAMELADAKLIELGDQSFTVVRQHLAQDLQLLRAIQLTDEEGLNNSLLRLMEMVDSLPIVSVPLQNLSNQEQSSVDMESALMRVWLRFKQAILGMVSVERVESLSTRALTAEEQAVIKKQLELELQIARLALSRRQSEVFQTSLSAANILLAREFDTNDARVEGASLLLQELVQLEIDPQYPDIGGSLELLRDLGNRE
ncbi:MAG: hypothetical protein CMM56_03690 [Rhodospirillaceae bacterium]|nr:hypothetical protein [Rhodospirillaceae bacterium]|tara:strand:- start:2447 stop:3559 length:1113 start_codon:yes stop_codon:yes gene_type:complete